MASVQRKVGAKSGSDASLSAAAAASAITTRKSCASGHGFA